MNGFFVLNKNAELVVTEEFSGFVIFYHKSTDPVIAEVQFALLEKLIRNGLKLSPENFLFVDVKKSRVRLAELQKTIEIKKCFLFGVEEREIGINFDASAYQLISVSNIQFLKADAPEVLAEDKNLKNKLWSQLQESFNLSK